MALGSALSLLPELRCIEYEARAEQLALTRLAGWAGRFSSLVSLDPPRTLLLEIGGSMHFFGGSDALHGKLESALDALGYQVIMATAPWPLAARVLSHAAHSVWIQDSSTLADHLNRLDVEVLNPDKRMRTALESIGAVRLEDLWKLPRAGLAKRFGPDLLNSLDKMTGRSPDPRTAFVPPPRFTSKLELPAAVEDTQALVFAAQRLLQELSGFSTGLNRGVQAFQLRLHAEQGSAMPLTIRLAKAGSDHRHWLNLLRERLQQTLLNGPVAAISLHAHSLPLLAERSFDLFAEDQSESDWPRLLERLRNRLGDKSVQRPGIGFDHRPEHAWKSQAVEESVVEYVNHAERPLWLLHEPRLLPQLPKSWQTRGPERIESGWWDGADANRDYYLAITPKGERFWIFRQRIKGEWFMHGLFS